MKNKLFKVAAVITFSVFLLAGAVIAAPGIIDFATEKPAQPGQNEQVQPEAEGALQSFSADVKDMDDYGKVQYPMIVLIFGFTVIVAVVNYGLREKE